MTVIIFYDRIHFKETEMNQAPADLTIHERFQHYTEAEGWRYLPNPQTWSGGVWVHDELGSVNKGGGLFEHINEAVEAIDRFYTAMAM